jgi:uncharacterized membrane protein
MAGRRTAQTTNNDEIQVDHNLDGLDRRGVSSEAAAAYANLLVAAVFSSASGRVGDSSLAMATRRAQAAGVLLLHLVLGCVSGLLICGIGRIRLRVRRKLGSLPSNYRLFVEFVAVLVIAFTGHPGGILSGANASG